MSVVTVTTKTTDIITREYCVPQKNAPLNDEAAFLDAISFSNLLNMLLVFCFFLKRPPRQPERRI